MDTEAIGGALLSTVPFARTLGIEFVRAEPAATGVSAVVRLPDRANLHNHVGGPHAGALFALGDTASGAVVMATFADQLGRAVPLVVTAGVVYRKLARGQVTATATLREDPATVVAALDAGERPEFSVDVEITRDDGAVVATMTITWTLRPN